MQLIHVLILKFELSRVSGPVGPVVLPTTVGPSTHPVTSQRPRLSAWVSWPSMELHLAGFCLKLGNVRVAGTIELLTFSHNPKPWGGDIDSADFLWNVFPLALAIPNRKFWLTMFGKLYCNIHLIWSIAVTTVKNMLRSALFIRSSLHPIISDTLVTGLTRSTPSGKVITFRLIGPITLANHRPGGIGVAYSCTAILWSF